MQTYDMVFEEACRLVGQCYLELAQRGAATEKEVVASELRNLQLRYRELTGAPNRAVEMAIVQLKPC
ncbi:DUF2767 domain-containing protein [Pantoea sp.]|uniref:DUF2767 domain-containing protein n=1 Tax=Pantoea sp. TaxID=69393 RepID=UPI0031D70ADA